ncbi:MAG: alpha/beta fold hydrolase [Propionibacteriaceae bacterium]|nr:alpha/beta fold hydrolase [Propionibacteriaceae bacterium]
MGRPTRTTLRSAHRLGITACVLLVLASGCSLVSTEPPGRNESPSFSDGRPLRPIPKVRPDGFSDPPDGRGLSRYQVQQLDWRPCDKGLQCATALVPLNYSQPDGSAITLALAKRPATGTAKLGSLFINPGGPGGSGVNYVGYFKYRGLENYDIVGWDPRGVGRSTPVDCSGEDLDSYVSMDISPDDTREESALIEANRELGLACLKRSGVLLQHVSTAEVARDLDLLRGLVGEDKTNFFGTSYGTQIGATYAELFPTRVGRMVLDGAVNITDDKSVTQAQGFDRALGAFANWCAGRDCELGKTRAEVLQSIVALWTRLDGDPIKVGGRRLTQQLAVAGVVGVLYANQDAYKYLLQALRNAIEDDDGRFLLFLADQLNRRNDRGEFGQLVYAFPAVRCLDQADSGIRGELDAAAAASEKAPTVGPFFGPDLVCPMWPVAAVEKMRLTGAGAPPIVVIGTTGDPATPYEFAVGMANQLESGVLVTFKGRGHTAYRQSGCVQQLVIRYLNQGVVPPDKSSC